MINKMDVSRIKELFNYDENTGVLTWKNKPSNGCKRLQIGAMAGTINRQGYVMVKVDGVLYPAHRIIWAYVYEKFPDSFIDHKNGVRDDNRINNLRECTHSQNVMNTPILSNNTSGYRGVVWHKNVKKWIAQVSKKYIGSFDTKEEAAAAYEKAAREKFGEFYREQS